MSVDAETLANIVVDKFGEPAAAAALADLVARVARLQAALREYGDHQSWRCGHPDRYEQDPDCPCGLVQTWRDLGWKVEYDESGCAVLTDAALASGSEGGDRG